MYLAFCNVNLLQAGIGPKIQHMLHKIILNKLYYVTQIKSHVKYLIGGLNGNKRDTMTEKNE